MIEEPRASSLRTDGSRAFVRPADVRGRFTRARRIGFAILVFVWAALPSIPVGGRPAMFLDVPARRFFLFGGSFNAQDFWFAFFAVTALLFSLLVLTTLLGRAWCGWACPQTVFLEGFYRPIERLIEGPRNERIRRAAGPLSLDRVWRGALKHSLFLLLSVCVAHVFLAYFVSLPSVFQMIGRSPAEHPEAFGWMVGTSLVFYGNFAWFREQICVVVCPYGRLQSVLIDADSLVVGYDARRGEPRGKQKDAAVGACVDCGRCAVACPTGIDIRNGLQLDCIACSQCADACDEVMEKLGRPRGLVRYDSLRGLRGEKRRYLRPRLGLYAFLGVLGLVVASFALRTYAPFEANLLRMRGAPYVIDRGEDRAHDVIRNQFEIHIVNKRDVERGFRVEVLDGHGADVAIAQPSPRIEALGSRRVAIVVRHPRRELARGRIVRVRVSMEREEHVRELALPILGPAVAAATPPGATACAAPPVHVSGRSQGPAESRTWRRRADRRARRLGSRRSRGSPPARRTS